MQQQAGEHCFNNSNKAVNMHQLVGQH
jgi:hypothetical protein